MMDQKLQKKKKIECAAGGTQHKLQPNFLLHSLSLHGPLVIESVNRGVTLSSVVLTGTSTLISINSYDNPIKLAATHPSVQTGKLRL